MENCIFTHVKKIINCIILMLLCVTTFAQLPKIEVVNVRGRNFVSWKNTYDGLQSIVVQRSNDSTKGYVTIGTINKPKKGDGLYNDEAPMIGKNFYQLIINFSEDINWYSLRKGISLDSVGIAKPILPIATTQTIEPVSVKEVIIAVPEFSFTPSNHVYTNTYSGHVNVVLENTISKRYSIIFYGVDKKEALKIDRLGHDNIVIDKHNFNGHGVYSFILRDGADEVEKGFLKIN
jgi:hypothetical protein